MKQEKSTADLPEIIDRNASGSFPNCMERSGHPHMTDQTPYLAPFLFLLSKTHLSQKTLNYSNKLVTDALETANLHKKSIMTNKPRLAQKRCAGLENTTESLPLVQDIANSLQTAYVMPRNHGKNVQQVITSDPSN